MRREGFELSVSPPRVVYREEGGHKLEPLEEVICEVEEDQAGSVIEVDPRRGTVTCLKADMHSFFYGVTRSTDASAVMDCLSAWSVERFLGDTDADTTGWPPCLCTCM